MIYTKMILEAPANPEQLVLVRPREKACGLAL
jgi:hypothetical protein